MTTEPEFSRRYAVDRVSVAGIHFDVSAGAEERAALLQRLELASLGRLEASGMIERCDDGLVIALRCHIRAELEQVCVVTAEPVPVALDLEVERLFLPAGINHAAAEDGLQEIALSPELDEPDPLTSPFLDIGEVIAEEIALALDPYPHAPDADRVLAEVNRAAEPEGPFAALAALRGQAH